MAFKVQNLIGQRFGLLVVTERAENRGKRVVWLCQCDCGNIFTTLAQNLRTGKSTHCGCMLHENISKASTTHGYSKTRTYRSWNKMKGRCCNPNDDRYCQYGGAGITLYERWVSFENFLSDMGERPEGTSIDRIDNTKGYCPENCKWSTPKEQMNNTSINRNITYKGKTQTLTQWCDELKLSYSMVSTRLSRGMCVDKAFTLIKNHNIRKLTCNGKTRTITEWSYISGISVSNISTRLRRGWTLERILKTPVKRS